MRPLKPLFGIMLLLVTVAVIALTARILNPGDKPTRGLSKSVLLSRSGGGRSASFPVRNEQQALGITHDLTAWLQDREFVVEHVGWNDLTSNPPINNAGEVVQPLVFVRRLDSSKTNMAMGLAQPPEKCPFVTVFYCLESWGPEGSKERNGDLLEPLAREFWETFPEIVTRHKDA